MLTYLKIYKKAKNINIYKRISNKKTTKTCL